mmetsp:Transcript_1702/g.3454  ORF Transcript_1702/g.3454 Transcript_1702/m.3454 type:complete len:256 (-) Transcript_1702:136-903(-)
MRKFMTPVRSIPCLVLHCSIEQRRCPSYRGASPFSRLGKNMNFHAAQQTMPQFRKPKEPLVLPNAQMCKSRRMLSGRAVRRASIKLKQSDRDRPFRDAQPKSDGDRKSTLAGSKAWQRQSVPCTRRGNSPHLIPWTRGTAHLAMIGLEEIVVVIAASRPPPPATTRCTSSWRRRWHHFRPLSHVGTGKTEARDKSHVPQIIRKCIEAFKVMHLAQAGGLRCESCSLSNKGCIKLGGVMAGGSFGCGCRINTSSSA